MQGTIAGRLLQIVVAAALTGTMADGRAETYDLDGVRAYFPYDDHWVETVVVTGDPYFDPYEGQGDDTDVPTELPDSSDGGGGADGDGDVPEASPAECEAIAAKVDDNCDLSNPPLVITNGCGSEGSELVPDYLIINLIPVTRLGPIFTGACNLHDICYGTYAADKAACDMVLYTNMIGFAKRDLTDTQWTFYGLHVTGQAYLYSNALQSPFLAGASGEAFEEAQSAGACRYYSKKAREAGCIQ